jgi:hypothetical protein
VLTIREPQVEALRQALLSRFEDRCVALAQRDWGELYAAWPEARVRDEVRAVIATGPRWGFETERALYRLVNLDCMLGLGALRTGALPWVFPILEASGHTVSAKVAAVIARFEREPGVR